MRSIAKSVFIVAFVLSLAMLSLTVHADQIDTVRMTLDSTIVTKGSVVLAAPPLAPISMNGRVMLPFRYLVQTVLGGDVDYDGDTRRITAHVSGSTIIMVVDQQEIFINGMATDFGQAPIVINGSTLVPLRAFEVVLESLVWDPITSSVSLTPLSLTDPELDASRIAYQSGIKALANRDFVKAISDLKQVITRDRDYENAKASLSEAIAAYKANLFDTIKRLETSSSLNDIAVTLNSALAILPADAEITAMLSSNSKKLFDKNKEYVYEQIAEISNGVAITQNYLDAISGLEAMLREYPEFSTDINIEIAKNKREHVMQQIANISIGATSAPKIDAAISELKKLLVTYPDYSSNIRVEIDKLTSQLLKLVRVSLSEDSIVLVSGSSMQLSVTYSPSDIKNIDFTFASSNSTVAGVDNSGRVSASKQGTTLVSVLSSDGSVLATCDVEVPTDLTALRYSDYSSASSRDKLYVLTGTATDVENNSFSKGLVFFSRYESYNFPGIIYLATVSYELNSEYSKLSGKAILPTSISDVNISSSRLDIENIGAVELSFYGDGRHLETIKYITKSSPADFEVNVNGVNSLSIQISGTYANGWNTIIVYTALVNMGLTKN